MNDQIYIQIPAYRDNQLQSTLYDLIANARHKERLRIGVAWQHEAGETLDMAFIKKHKIEILDIPARKSRGCNWARALLQERWLGEKYTLLLDSHHRFISGWDDRTVQMYETLKATGVEKPILTAYLPEYEPANDPGARRQNPLRIRYFKREQGLLFRLTGHEIQGWQGLSAPIAAHFVSLHFLFAAGTFNDELEFDPSIYFFADEIAIALRAFTKGYDLFHPHTVLGWHLYNRTATRVPHWSDHPEWRQQIETSYAELTNLYRGQKIGRFGIGADRTIDLFEAHIGMRLIDYHMA